MSMSVVTPDDDGYSSAAVVNDAGESLLLPFTAMVTTLPGGVRELSFSGLQLRRFAGDIAGRAGRRHVVVYDVEIEDWQWDVPKKVEKTGLLGFAAIAGISAKGLEFWEHKRRVTKIATTVRLATVDLPAFLATIHSVNLSLIDLADRPSPKEMRRLHKKTWNSERGLLDHYPDSSVFVTIHDDFYLRVETRADGLIEDLLRTALSHHIGRIVATRTGLAKVAITPPGDEIVAVVAEFPEGVTSIESLRVDSPPDLSPDAPVDVRVQIARGYSRHGQVPPEDVAVELRYEHPKGTWSIERRG